MIRFNRLPKMLIFVFVFSIDMAAGHAQSTAIYEKYNIAVVSDFHLRFLAQSNVHQITALTSVSNPDAHSAALDSILSFLSGRPGITDVVLNGDIFHAPTLGSLSDQDRIELIANTLIYIQGRLGKKVHFNFGNHDEKWIYPKGERPYMDANFSLQLAARVHQLADHGIHLIGTNSSQIYAYEINGLKFEFAHMPFVKTDELVRQARRVPLVIEKDGSSHIDPAVVKLTSKPSLTEQEAHDGVARVFSDNHLALADPENRVYDTGKTTLDANLPNEPKAFLLLTRSGRGRLLEVAEQGKVRKFKEPIVSCSEILQ